MRNLGLDVDGHTKVRLNFPGNFMSGYFFYAKPQLLISGVSYLMAPYMDMKNKNYYIS